MKRKVISVLLCIVAVLCVLLWQTTKPANAAQELQPYVTTADSTAEEVLSAWETGAYSYVKLGADLELCLSRFVEQPMTREGVCSLPTFLQNK